ncbi:MAG: response regulator [Oligoflexus sp.]
MQNQLHYPLNCKVLVVDDSPHIRKLIGHVLKTSGAQVAVACDGDQALTKIFRRIKIENPYDVIILDMRMPILDGFSTVQILRKKNILVPVLALTGGMDKSIQAREFRIQTHRQLVCKVCVS